MPVTLDGLEPITRMRTSPCRDGVVDEGVDLVSRL